MVSPSITNLTITFSWATDVQAVIIIDKNNIVKKMQYFFIFK